jgi:hypothetical protein
MDKTTKLTAKEAHLYQRLNDKGLNQEEKDYQIKIEMIRLIRDPSWIYCYMAWKFRLFNCRGSTTGLLGSSQFSPPHMFISSVWV